MYDDGCCTCYTNDLLTLIFHTTISFYLNYNRSPFMAVFLLKFQLMCTCIYLLYHYMPSVNKIAKRKVKHRILSSKQLDAE